MGGESSVRLLLAEGADRSLKDARGKTALDMARDAVAVAVPLAVDALALVAALADGATASMVPATMTTLSEAAVSGRTSSGARKDTGSPGSSGRTSQRAPADGVSLVVTTGVSSTEVILLSRRCFVVADTPWLPIVDSPGRAHNNGGRTCHHRVRCATLLGRYSSRFVWVQFSHSTVQVVCPRGGSDPAPMLKTTTAAAKLTTRTSRNDAPPPNHRRPEASSPRSLGAGAGPTSSTTPTWSSGEVEGQ